MPRISTIYLTADGHYLTRQSHTTQTFPHLAINPRDLKAHTLLGSPTFQKQSPVQCVSMEDLLNAPAPVPTAGNTAMLCEENNLYPLTLYPLTPEAELYNQANISQESLFTAVNGSTHDEYANPMNQTFFWVFLGIVTVLTLVLGFMLITLMLNSQGGATP